MVRDYSEVTDVPASLFEREAEKIRLMLQESGRDADAAEIARVEEFLEVQPGSLDKLSFRIDTVSCSCGNAVGLYDLVYTAAHDAGHSKSLVLHTLLGRKRVLSSPKAIRCSACGSLFAGDIFYVCWSYACSGGSTGQA